MFRFLRVGSDALLVELEGLEQAIALFESLDQTRIAGVEELIPAAKTVLIRFDPHTVTVQQLVAHVRARQLVRRSATEGTAVEIEVCYDGEDLEYVAEYLNVTTDEVVRRHTGTEYTVAFTGFAPGFGYLVGSENALDVPRRASPRVRIPAGSVALAGPFSGVYPRESPGGWQLIGRTSATLWDLTAERPALLQPGDRVRFTEVTSVGFLPGQLGAEQHEAEPARRGFPTPEKSGYGLEVKSPGVQTTLQDLGRPGRSNLGVSSSGAMDPSALRTANRLVGNAIGTAALEVAYGGIELHAHGQQVLSLAGAQVTGTVTTMNGRTHDIETGQVLGLNDRDTLTVGYATHGARLYLAARGGFALPDQLGSLATDTLSGIGPDILQAGDFLPVDRTGAIRATLDHEVTFPSILPQPNRVTTIDVLLGPRAHWFTEQGLESLFGQEWNVTPQSNRVGIRLEAELSLERAITEELPSEGTVAGAIQVPAKGQPIIFMADYPVTGGYPVVAVVANYHLRLAGQLPIGSRVRFHRIGEGNGMIKSSN